MECFSFARTTTGASLELFQPLNRQLSEALQFAGRRPRHRDPHRLGDDAVPVPAMARWGGGLVVALPVGVHGLLGPVNESADLRAAHRAPLFVCDLGEIVHLVNMNWPRDSGA